MIRLVLPVLCVLAAAGLIVGLVRRARRTRADATPELHQHPERLNQMLDPTDDA